MLASRDSSEGIADSNLPVFHSYFKQPKLMTHIHEEFSGGKKDFQTTFITRTDTDFHRFNKTVTQLSKASPFCGLHTPRRKPRMKKELAPACKPSACHEDESVDVQPTDIDIEYRATGSPSPTKVAKEEALRWLQMSTARTRTQLAINLKAVPTDTAYSPECLLQSSLIDQFISKRSESRDTIKKFCFGKNK